ncbi:DUF4168 domain-containing protein [Fodinibius salsisoli]|uniref:DUF4168 domain-containing protein n=1 Tax=Fodinibius salsisoli TaxID=2820877 RepID=A0ABT3PP38_9BACT|nr:DUF4168 domain-containing protein [Fodinibius salsisoli]MCW9707613.1 DUF4168 domain-containing protein [Fodinibius salsisoli]
MKCFKNVMPLLVGLLLMAGSAVAQVQQQAPQPAQADSITDQELQKFAQVSSESQKIRQEMGQKVDSMLAETDIDMQRFQKIMMSKRNPQMADSLDVTAEEEETIKEIQPKLMKMSQNAQQKMIGIIQNNGLNPQRFQQLMQAVRSNPEVMKRFQKITQDSMQN